MFQHKQIPLYLIQVLLKSISHESAIYFLDEFDINEKIRINAGLRYGTYQHVGPFTRYIKGDGISTADTTVEFNRGDLIRFYHGLEPRISLRWLMPDNSSIKAGYSYNYQYVHLTSLSAVSLPTDICILLQILQNLKLVGKPLLVTTKTF